MNILFDNVNFNSNSGPNSFGKRLVNELLSTGHQVNGQDPDVQLSFIQATQKKRPLVLRLDGIYFNSKQNWEQLNLPIKQTYQIADGVIYQSKFNQILTEKYFGVKEKSSVINNGTNIELINNIEPLEHKFFESFDKIWCCASSWRQHKRLKENIRYFLEHSGEKDCLIIAGDNPDYDIKHERIFYAGNLPWEGLIALYKRSEYFLHLALLDHCPNVVVDARASGCKIVCASSGGTKEIVAKGDIIIQDMEWDYKPFELYNPPNLDFSDYRLSEGQANIDIKSVATRYLEFLNNILAG